MSKHFTLQDSTKELLCCFTFPLLCFRTLTKGRPLDLQPKITIVMDLLPTGELARFKDF